MDDALRERFWKYVEKTDGCWLWLGHTVGRPGGGRYGGFRAGDKRIRAHRFSWLLHFGDPGDALVLHECDNPLCVRPSHLFLGTALDNARDRDAKGRHKALTRDQLAHTKLTTDLLEEIKRLSLTFSQREIARRYGCNQSAVSRALKVAA